VPAPTMTRPFVAESRLTASVMRPAPTWAPRLWAVRDEKSPWKPKVPGAVSAPEFRNGVESTTPVMPTVTVAMTLDPHQLPEAFRGAALVLVTLTVFAVMELLKT